MKPRRIICFVAVSFAFTWDLYAQGFVNLTFESTTITPVVFAVTRYTATVPGWTWTPGGNFVNGDPNSVGYNEFALDSPAVTLQGTNSPFFPAIQGSYSVLLQGGTIDVGPMNNTNGASIFQTGQIPVGAESMTYLGGSGLQVTFDGHSLAPAGIGGGKNYTVWSVDISAYAGQTGELRFTEPWQNTSILDDIQFSGIPEPSVFALVGVFVLCLLGTTKRPNFSVEPTRAAHAVSLVWTKLNRLRLRRGARPSACGSLPR